ncbi:MAG: hypothetical protein V1652_04160 [bacterium]
MENQKSLVALKPLISFFDDGENVVAYAHMPIRELFSGKKKIFFLETFDHAQAEISTSLGVCVIAHLFFGTDSCFDKAELTKNFLLLRINRNNEIAFRHLFNARERKEKALAKSKNRSLFTKPLFYIADQVEIDHLDATEDRAKRFFRREIERAFTEATQH